LRTAGPSSFVQKYRFDQSFPQQFLNGNQSANNGNFQLSN